GCAELRSNLFVEPAGNDAFEHFKLAWCERCESITHLLALQALKPLLGRPLESPLDGGQKIFVPEGFRQIIDWAAFHRLHTSRYAGTACNENDLLRAPPFPLAPPEVQGRLNPGMFKSRITQRGRVWGARARNSRAPVNSSTE